jgi:hypothetical protein
MKKTRGQKSRVRVPLRDFKLQKSHFRNFEVFQVLLPLLPFQLVDAPDYVRKCVLDNRKAFKPFRIILFSCFEVLIPF